MVPVVGRLPATTYKKKVIPKIKQFQLDPNVHIINFSNDGCSTMKKLGRLIKPILQQLCQAHNIQLAVLDVFYKKLVENEEESDEEDNVNDVLDESDEDDDFDDDFDDDSQSEDEEDENDDEIGLVDDFEDEPAEFKDENLGALVDKCRKIQKTYTGRSILKHDTLQTAIKNWQRENGKSATGFKLVPDCKTRWSSFVLMLESILKVKVPLKKVLKKFHISIE